MFKILDEQYLGRLQKEYNVSDAFIISKMQEDPFNYNVTMDLLIEIEQEDLELDSEIVQYYKQSGLDVDALFNVNVWIEIILQSAYDEFVNHVDDVIADLDIDFDMSDYEPCIYTNYIDSGFDSEIEEFDITDFSEENIINFLVAIGQYELVDN